MLELLPAPAWSAIDPGFADTLKLGGAPGITLRIRDVQWDSAPLVPLALTRYSPGGVPDVVVICSVDLPGPVDETVLNGVIDAVGPAGEIVAESLTSPVNPFKPRTVTVEVLLVPAGMVSEVELGDTSKSGELVLTNASRVHESVIVPLDPWTVMV